MREVFSDPKQYPFSLRAVLRANTFENIVDSNIFSAYIPSDLSVPRIEDPRRRISPQAGISRHPGYIPSRKIDQIFSYIGYVKRVRNREYKEYLPLLFSELRRFFKILVDIVFAPDLIISEDVYAEQKFGLENFIDMFTRRNTNDEDWIKDIWEHQKEYLADIDRLLMSLRRRGKVFSFDEDPLYKEIITICRNLPAKETFKKPSNVDISLVANCCLKAALDGKSKTLWSGDRDVKKLMVPIYEHPHITRNFPQIYLRAGYLPQNFKRLFPL